MALDFYAVRGDGQPLALVVEEFVLRDDYTSAALDSACFDGTWWSSAGYSRRLRTDTTVDVQPVSRPDAATLYARLGGSALDPDQQLRTHFTDRLIFADAAPLRLGPDDGRRIYRMLFARDLDERHLAGLLASLRLSPVDDPRVAGRFATGSALVELRRVGSLAWSIDLTVAEASTDVGPLIGTALLTARGHGLVPVTVERFA